ncbi:MAG: glycosyltransferase family 1 protein, partial [Bacteroidetes bacterium]
ARNMTFLLQHPAEAAEMGSAARQHVQKNYTLTRHIGQLQACIFAAMGQ